MYVFLSCYLEPGLWGQRPGAVTGEVYHRRGPARAGGEQKLGGGGGKRFGGELGPWGTTATAGLVRLNQAHLGIFSTQNSFTLSWSHLSWPEHIVRVMDVLAVWDGTSRGGAGVQTVGADVCVWHPPPVLACVHWPLCLARAQPLSEELFVVNKLVAWHGGAGAGGDQGDGGTLTWPGEQSSYWGPGCSELLGLGHQGSRDLLPDCVPARPRQYQDKSWA